MLAALGAVSVLWALLVVILVLILLAVARRL